MDREKYSHVMARDRDRSQGQVHSLFYEIRIVSLLGEPERREIARATERAKNIMMSIDELSWQESHAHGPHSNFPAQSPCEQVISPCADLTMHAKHE